MDLWVVAAAAGAGYLAKYWNKNLNSSDSSCHLSSEDSYFENTEPPSCPFPYRKMARKRELGKNVSLDHGTSSDVNSMDGLLTGEVASKRGYNCETVRPIRNHDTSDLLSMSNLAVPLSPYDNNAKHVDDGNEQNTDIFGSHCFFLPDFSAKVSPYHNLVGHKTPLKTKHLPGRVSKPLNSIESCFMAQLYKEHVKMEEYVFSPLSSPSYSSPTRPFRVSNGSRILNNRANDSFVSASTGSKENKLHKAGRVRDETIGGVPSLPKVGSLNDTKKMKMDAVIWPSQRLSSSDDVSRGKLIHTHYDPAFLVSFGISLGMITSIMANKREIDKLKEVLKQSENLVQDLQEELEMKDSMTVKELRGSQDTCDHSFNDKELSEFSPEKHMDNSPTIDCEESYDQKEEQSSESISKIEAELEAELERLGLDMDASSLERKVSELVEIDPEFVADFAQGEFRADTHRGKDFVHPKSNEDVTDTTPLPGNYAVLPHELSLRLHEVIQSQLEERVKELEIALETSQRKVRFLEFEHEGNFQKESSLTHENCDTMSQPLILNLAGEALDAYNEAYEELIKINDSEENSPSTIHDNKEGSDPQDWDAIGVGHGGENGITAYSTIDERRLSSELYSIKVTMSEGQSSSIYELNDSGDESCDFDNEMERQLIRQIVERTKKGSPVFQHAQKILYSMDEEH